MVMPRSCSSFRVSVNRLWICQLRLHRCGGGVDVRFTGFGGGDDTSTLDEGIGQGGFAVVDLG